MKLASLNNLKKRLSLINGHRINAISNKVPLFDKQGNLIGVLGTSIDITEQKNLEKN